jgi:tetratricopeptide (TPR) repeat protein
MTLNNRVRTSMETGVAHLRGCKYSAAEDSFRSALTLDPTNPDAMHLLGVALGHQNQFDEAMALIESAISSSPQNSDFHRSLGVFSRDAGEPKKSISSIKKALLYDREDIGLYNELAFSYVADGDAKKAIDTLKKAIKKYPDFTKAHSSLAKIQMEIGNTAEAIASHKIAIKLEPSSMQPREDYAKALLDLGRAEDAAEQFEIILSRYPDSVTYANLGHAYRALGQSEKALNGLNKAIELNPENIGAYYNRGLSISRYEAKDPLIPIMEELYSRPDLKDIDRKYLGFALSKVHEDLADYETSFRYLAEGNRLRRKEFDYDLEEQKQLFDLLKKTFSERQTLPKPVSTNENSNEIRPIFILGMPRSGTSLVEQILSSHSSVHGAGELKTMSRLVSPLLKHSDGYAGQEGQKLFSRNDLNSVRDKYLKDLKTLKVPEKVISDKATLNFRWIGFILLAFPNARIVNLNRDPRAICWSIYKLSFSGMAHGYAYNQEELAEYYGMYQDLMAFWHEWAPGKIYDLHYEKLTENQEEESRALIEFCGLDWEDQCLEFHKTKRAVKTASSSQVRKKLYRGSSEAWRNYEPFLQPLLKGLGYQNAEI